jgi:hypothetical protein
LASLLGGYRLQVRTVSGEVVTAVVLSLME